MSPESSVIQKPSRPSRLWLWASALLALAGIGVSAYLSAKRLSGGSLVCTRWAQCDTVNNSVYAVMYGVPVAFLGLAGYLALLVLALIALTSNGTAQRRVLLVSFLLALGGVGFSLYLTYLELYVIHAVCSWCVASAIIITLLMLFAARSVYTAFNAGR